MSESQWNNPTIPRVVAQCTSTRCARDHDNVNVIQTVHLRVTVRSGRVFETYLCELCALDLAIQPFVKDLIVLTEEAPS